MSRYNEDQITQAFRIYSLLAAKGQAESRECRIYKTDDEVRALVDLFVEQVDCTLFPIADESLILIPLALTSPFHVTNESIRREYFPAKAVNLDIYMMYVGIIVLFGEFYDSYQNQEATRSFIPADEWLNEINQRMAYLGAMEPERLAEADREFEYNWTALCEKWEALNDVRDGVKADGRTVSRMAFLNTVIRFLEDRKLAEQVGPGEIALTPRAHQIVGHYFMNSVYNRNILEFLYPGSSKGAVRTDAIAQEA